MLLVIDRNVLSSFPQTDSPTLVLDICEEQKTLGTVERIWRFLHKENATRHTPLVAVGGGTLLDVAGFAAATFKRGIPCIYIPTTLLAMVDASIGGKTGCNFCGIKNEIGVFAQPKKIGLYPPLLNSLPYEQWLSGFAEMLKHALIADKKEFYLLLQCLEENQPREEWLPLIEYSRTIKERIYQQDPYDHGYRHILNFGHTVGHAVEAMALRHSRPLYHGYAVMQGMVAETYLSVLKEGCPREVLQLLGHTMTEYYGRAECRCKDLQLLLDLMRADKKNTDAGHISFTLLKDIGQPVHDLTVPDKDILEALDYLFSL